MSVLIKGMEMPQSCSVCPLMTTVPFDFDEYCTQTGEYADQYSRPDDCPLVEIPPHGRLIDADALTDAIESADWYHQAPNKEMVHGANSAEHQAWYKEQDIYSALENAPTIIEAEEGE